MISKYKRLMKYKEALELALYYVEGDATWEGLKVKIDKLLEDEPTWNGCVAVIEKPSPYDE